MSRILVVDDDLIFRKVLSNLLTGHGYEIVLAENGKIALEALETESFDLMISDVMMEPMDGMELLHITRELYPTMGIVMLTGHATINTAVEAMKNGAFDYVVKPFRLDELFKTVQRVLEYYNITQGSQPLVTHLENRGPLTGFVAQSASMYKVCELAERVAPTNVTVLLRGEEGSGKKLLARAIHDYSHRANKPRQTLSCSQTPASQIELALFGQKVSAQNKTPVPPGLFKTASGGTLLLHGIGALPLDVQPQLLAALLNKKNYKVRSAVQANVDVRVIATSSQNLNILVKQGAFDPELCRLLNAFCIDIPPLRERTEDILPLIDLALRQNLDSNENSPVLDLEAKEVLCNYNWPGNVRELREVILHASSLAQNKKITKQTLPANIINATKNTARDHATTKRREQLRGRSFKEFLLNTKKDLLKPEAPKKPPKPMPPVNSVEEEDRWMLPHD